MSRMRPNPKGYDGVALALPNRLAHIARDTEQTEVFG